MTRRLIRTDGTEIRLDGPVSLDDVRRMINAEGLDIVALHHLGYPLEVMFVDDAGYETTTVEHDTNHFELVPTRARKPVNAKATALYLANCVPGTTHEIVGDVVIVYDDDTA